MTPGTAPLPLRLAAAPRLRLKKSPPPLERYEQENYFAWLRYVTHEFARVADFAYAIPNGAYYAGNAKARAVQGNSLAKQGLKRGVPDVCVAIPVAPYHGLYLEFKRLGAQAPAAGDAQDLWAQRLRAQGYAVFVAHGFEQAKALTLAYLAGMP